MYVILEALDGPSVGARTNVAVGQTVRIGREAGNDFVVPQDPTLSRTHFLLSYDGTGCRLQNQSRYGTFVNNRRVDDEDVVHDGDELRAGVCRFSVRFASDDSIRKSTTPEMPVVADDPQPVPESNHRGVAGLPPIEEDEPIAPPGGQPHAAAVYGLPPIEEEEPLAEPGAGGRSSRRSSVARPVQPAAAASPHPDHGHAAHGHGGHSHLPAATPAAAAPQADHLRVPVDEHGLRAEPLVDVLGRVKLDDEARSAIGGAGTLRAVIDTLAGRGLTADALKVLAAALPPQAGVRWACRCVREAGPVSESDEAALVAAEQWAADPTENNRRAAQAVAEKLEFSTAAAWAAVAAFWSGGSMAPPDVPVVPPPPDLMPQALTGAVSLAVVAHTPEKAPERQQQFLKLGLPDGAAG